MTLRDEMLEELLKNPAAIAAACSAIAAFLSVVVATMNAHAARQNVRDQMIRYATELLEKTREDRRKVRQWRPPNDGSNMPEDIRRSCEKVARVFDIIGFLDRTKKLDRSFIDSFYSGSFVDLYEGVLGSYIESERRERSPRHFWEAVNFYERVRYVNRWHPANTGSRNWPRNARKFHWSLF
jgi:hypothetical protein